MNAVVDFAQIVKKATCLMTVTQYNSKTVSHLNSFEKRNHLDELINMSSKAEENL